MFNTSPIRAKKRLTDAQQALINDNYGFFIFYYRKFIPQNRFRAYFTEEEIYEICCAALMDAAVYYDESLGFKFTTYASRCMLRRLIVERKRKINRDKSKVKVYIFKDILSNNSGSRTSIDSMNKSTESEDNEMIENETKLAVEIEKLPERMQYVIKHRYSKESKETLDVIAEKLGVSKERVRQIEASAISRLKVNCGVIQ